MIQQSSIYIRVEYSQESYKLASYTFRDTIIIKPSKSEKLHSIRAETATMHHSIYLAALIQ